MCLVFTPSEALLSSFRQSFKKSLRFYLLEPKGAANFGCPILKLHTLNCHSLGACQGIAWGRGSSGVAWGVAPWG